MKTKAIVINTCYGGFGLSHLAVMRYAELKGITLYPWIDNTTKEIYGDRATLDNSAISIHYTFVSREEYEAAAEEEKKKPIGPGRFVESNKLYFSGLTIPRDDLDLIKVVKEMGGKAGGRYSKLRIVEIPAEIDYIIEEYDGKEWVAEKHKTWC